MAWIDLKVRKPTEADGDLVGRVFVRTETGGLDIVLWGAVSPYHVAWMPIPEFTPLPDPPEGYELLVDYGLLPHPEALFWSGQWMERAGMNKDRAYNQDSIYAIPIKPPEPQYRPFQNADEFRPYRERWWKTKNAATLYPPANYNNNTHHGHSWLWCFENIEFDDGTPFGMPVGGDE